MCLLPYSGHKCKRATSIKKQPLSFNLYNQKKFGKNTEKTRIARPMTKTVMVLFETPFHSFRTIPQKLLNVTFKAISIDHENASIMALSARKLLPMESPKNCEYHRTPAKAQNNRLLTHSLPVILE